MPVERHPIEIEPAEVRHIAELARLKLSDDEVTLMGAQLSLILAYFHRLQGVSTDEVAGVACAGKPTDVLRDDVVVPSMSQEEALANAPQREGDFFRVPKVTARPEEA